MKVLGVNGSPRVGGNTDILLDKVLEGARAKGADTEKIILNELDFAPCQECEDIRNDGTCIIEDDFIGVYRKIKEADCIVIASPIFFGSISAQTKMMIDRFQCAWWAKYKYDKDLFEKRKVGAFVSVAATSRTDFFENAKTVVKHFFSVTNIEYKEELYCTGFDEKGSVLKSAETLKKALKLGEKLFS